MIIKVIQSKKPQKSHFERLGRYILNAKDNDSILFKRTAEYVIDLKVDGEKVGWSRVSNCQSDMPAVAIAEVLATQAGNQRAKSDKTYHLVVSLPHGENLTREQAADIEDSICNGLGFGDHQRISAVHKDTDHFHLHIAINKIHPTSFRCIEPYYPYYKLDTLAKELEIKHGLFQANRIGDGKRFAHVADLEAHQQEKSFVSWLNENLAERITKVLNDGKSWQDLHALFTEYGAIIKPRGAGLAIVTLDGKVAIKASSLDRKLSFKALTDRFGEYEPPNFKEREGKQYRPDARKQSETNALFAEYQRARQASYDTRTKALRELRAERDERRSEVKQRYAKRRASVKANTQMDNRTKLFAYHELSQGMKRELSDLKQHQDARKKAISEQSPAMTWEEYLANSAEQGNAEALSVLRRRKGYRQQLSQALLTVKDFENARDIVKPHFKPTVLKNGRVIYRAKDGGIVFDEATSISVKEVTEAATVLALSLADERFRGKALVVEGSSEFKLQVARLSALQGLSIRFVDPALENDRQRYLQSREVSRPRLEENKQRKEKNLGLDSGNNYRGR